MVYSTADQVKAIVSTNMLDADVLSLIAETDAYLDSILNTGALSDTIKQLLSRHYTAYRVMLRDPNSRSLGGYSEQRGVALNLMKQEFDTLVAAFSGGMSFTAAAEELS